MPDAQNNHYLLILTVIAALIGFLVGNTANEKVNAIDDVEEKRTIVMLIRLPGELIMNLLKFLIVPFIFISLVNAVATVDKKIMKIAYRTFIYFLGTTLLAVVLGIVLVTSIKPGARYQTVDSISDLTRSFPQAANNQLPETYRVYNMTVEITQLNTKSRVIAEFDVNATHKIVTVKEMVRSNARYNIPGGTIPVLGSSIYILGLVLFSLVLGNELSGHEEDSSLLKKIFNCLKRAMIKTINLAMWVSPIGICSLIAANLTERGDNFKSFEALAMLMMTSMAGVLIHTFATLPLIYLIVIRKNPYDYIATMSDALMEALITASSAVTLETAINCAGKKIEIDGRITKFLLSLGTSVNLNGAALFQAIGPIWIAQMNNIPMTAGKVFTTGVFAIATSVGTGVPSAGLITMAIICEAINVPAEDIGLMFLVDWFSERLRTVCSVMGNAFGAAVIFKLSEEDLRNGKPITEAGDEKKEIH